MEANLIPTTGWSQLWNYLHQLIFVYIACLGTIVAFAVGSKIDQAIYEKLLKNSVKSVFIYACIVTLIVTSRLISVQDNAFDHVKNNCLSKGIDSLICMELTK